MTDPIDLTEAKRLMEAATPGPWIVQDGCSWRRIGTREGDGDVLCPTNSRSDGHPDLTASAGMCGDNLALIAWAGTHLPTLIAAHEAALREIEALREGLGTMASGRYPDTANDEAGLTISEARDLARALSGDRS